MTNNTKDHKIYKAYKTYKIPDNFMPPSPIAIDGEAASGKGTLAKALAKKFHFAHLDTGSLYRMIGFLMEQKQYDPNDEENALLCAKQLDLKSIAHNKIRTPKISLYASQLARHKKVRYAILEHQRDFAYHPPNNKKGSILDGRDIGTFVLPRAPVKLFITASLEARAKRRFLEWSPTNPTLEKQAVFKALQARDEADKTRALAPLQKSQDAHLIDSSQLGIEEMIKLALAIIFKSQEI